jgi:Pentapeptide repeats (8 copies)
MITSRNTVLWFLGGAALLTGFYFTLDKLKVTLEIQLADRFVQAVDQLGKENLELRLGGIYGLERIAKRSENFYRPAMDILITYVREHAQWKAPSSTQAAQSPPKPAADLQAALTVLGRRTRTYNNGESQRLDLRNLDLRRANLSSAHLEGAILSGAHLEGAILNGARMEESILREAHMEDASLIGAHLEKAYLGGARLEGAKLRGAHLEEAFVSGAGLDGADLLGANLSDAFGLTWEQIKMARKDNKTRLPAYLSLRAR